MTTKTTAQDRIHAAATEAGWATRTGATPAGAGTVEYRQGTRRVRVYFGVYGQVIEAAWQTGSTGGRSIGRYDTGKEARVVEVLRAARWTRTAASA